MIDYSEKRDYIRMSVHCPVSIRELATGPDEPAQLLDLSAGGVRFIGSRALDTGARLQLTLRPEHPITPPLAAEVAVVRCHEIENGFDIAASIELLEPAIYEDA